jgi:hypothetical protein
MTLQAMVLMDTAANTAAKAKGGLVFGLGLAAFGVALVIRPEFLARFLRRGSKEGDWRSYFAADLEKFPWKGRFAGAFALLWGGLFVALSIYMMSHQEAFG